ncbi:MAG: transposase, partial [Deltaproteobacteria bacterium]
MKKFYTAGLGVYIRNITHSNHEAGKKNTRKTERRHLTLRTRV